MKKIIFLDIDGVVALDKQFFMNRAKFHKKHPAMAELRVPYPWDEGAVKVLNEILDATDAEIVLSSDWRLHWNLDELKGIFTWNGVKKSPIAVTPNIVEKMSSDLEDERQYQIQEYKREHKPESWVAIDDLDMSIKFLGDRFASKDDSDKKPGLKNFVHTPRSREGIKQSGIKKKVLKHLL